MVNSKYNSIVPSMASFTDSLDTAVSNKEKIRPNLTIKTKPLYGISVKPVNVTPSYIMVTEEAQKTSASLRNLKTIT